MSVWEKYTKEGQDQYIQFLKVYGALSNLFRQKKGDMIPYLDSKFQETVYAKSFNSKNVDIGNTPHDILSEFGNERIGIGLKTWMNTSPSYQKVMQLKRYQKEIEPYILKGNLEDLAYKISSLKNERMRSDYERLGLSEDKNIYHYITRDKGKFVLQECAYPLIDINNIQNPYMTDKSFTWNDGAKFYKYTFGDSQIWQRFSTDYSDTHIIDQCQIDIIDFSSQKDDRYYYREGRQPFYKKLSDEVTKKYSIYQWRRQYVRENKTGVVPTLTANMGTGGHNVPIILSDSGIRKLTPRETFNAQGFPMDFKLPENMSNGQLYKQAGNSVVVPVVKRIAVNMEKALDTVTKKKKSAKEFHGKYYVMYTSMKGRFTGESYLAKVLDSEEELVNFAKEKDINYLTKEEYTKDIKKNKEIEFYSYE
ncbi:MULTISPECIES: DNA cytosine methyltransferase [Staphylococcus]|uniref:DNA cytosine methyltransferase n=1 Tax=Staphylococcus TaxID=1279 RepID=UPI0007642BC9|nr:MULTISPECIES: DNA cytosine methyltransferase [Staphylococcus]KXA46340.1 C-5 cytosine-specific DNA methylase [Staphylococcus simulans]OFM20672.1 hypothetical protein HMPREF2713_00440 [Staphylococcus sp. HMSC059E03]OFN22034.1 hypothetical protein HMPREF2603_12445 [Staphylococcus sp. HMSC055C03]OFV07577.1 hypothetical protein HMPREF3124_03170 [Staphylococcus sp. HMSC12H08]OHR55054.1 hypothetical protein HMPREF2798_06100 [Staphylococcus sp. HMSC070A03]